MPDPKQLALVEVPRRLRERAQVRTEQPHVVPVRSHEILDRLFEILAILGLSLVQTIELEHNRLGSDPGFSPAAQALASRLSPLSPPLLQDRPLSGEIHRIALRLDGF